jgi:uncharacterized protein YnzC (UPF0291/DUF896 family)
MDKIVTKSQMQTILDNRPKGVPMDDVLKAYVSNGYKVEGVNYTAPQTMGQKAKDLAVGFAKGAGRTITDTATGVQNIGTAVLGGAESLATGKPLAQTQAMQPNVGIEALKQETPQGQALTQSLEPTNDTQKYGGYAETGAEALAGGGYGLIKDATVGGAKLVAKGAKPVIDTASKVISKVAPTSESIMQRVARIPKGEQAKFEKLTGKSVGTFLDETGNYGTPDKIIEKLHTDFQKSKATADSALETLQGTYRATPVRTALDELAGKVQRTSSVGAPDADLARVTELSAKEKSKGLTMSEINEVKRIFERRVRLDYLKEGTSQESITKATNIDKALHDWQMVEASKAGLTNLQEINKFTQTNKQLMDALGKEQAGIGGNNALGLTDAILVAGGSPESIASLVTKKVLSDKGVQSYVAKKISKIPVKTGVPKAQFKEKLQLPAPSSGSSKVSIEVPISLLSKSQSAIEKELVIKFGKKYTKAQVYEMANRLKELPSPKAGASKVSIEVPIKVNPTNQKDISKGFPKSSKKGKQ